MSRTDVPKWFTIVSVIGLLWNAFGVLMFFVHLTMGPEQIAELAEDQQVFMNNFPSQHYIAYGVATITGLLGCIGLLMKAKWARLMFLISLIGIAVNFRDTYVLANDLGIWSEQWLFMPILVSTIGIGLLLISNTGIKRSWLR